MRRYIIHDDAGTILSRCLIPTRSALPPEGPIPLPTGTIYIKHCDGCPESQRVDRHGKVVPRGRGEKLKRSKQKWWGMFHAELRRHLDRTADDAMPDSLLTDEERAALIAKRRASRLITHNAKTPAEAMQMLVELWSENT